MPWHTGVLLTLEALSLRGSHTSWRYQTTHPRAHLSSANLSTHSPTTSSIRLLLGTTIPLPWSPRANYKTTRDCPVPQSPLKWFKPANPKPAYSASPVPSLKNHNMVSFPQKPWDYWLLPIVAILPLPPDRPWCFSGILSWCGILPPLGIYKYIKLFLMANIFWSVGLTISE